MRRSTRIPIAWSTSRKERSRADDERQTGARSTAFETAVLGEFLDQCDFLLIEFSGEVHNTQFLGYSLLFSHRGLPLIRRACVFWSIGDSSRLIFVCGSDVRRFRRALPGLAFISAPQPQISTLGRRGQRHRARLLSGGREGQRDHVEPRLPRNATRGLGGSRSCRCMPDAVWEGRTEGGG